MKTIRIENPLPCFREGVNVRSLLRRWADNDGTNFGFFIGCDGRRPPLQAFHSPPRNGKALGSIITKLISATFAFLLMGQASSVGGTLGNLTYVNNYIAGPFTEGITILDCSENAVGALVIPDTIEGKPVNDIAQSAFKNCTGLTSISIPESIIRIQSEAFYNCTGLTSVTIPSSVIYWGGIVYFGCTGLTNVTIESGVTSIPSGIFAGCSSLTSVLIPNTVTSIENTAFSKCTNLASVNIPSSVTSIGDWAFTSTGLTSITIPDSVTSIGGSIFYDCSSLTSVTIPNSITSIPGGMFHGCSSLTNVTIPESVTSIEFGVFQYCTSLASITIPSSVTFISQAVFMGCTSLTNVTIPSSVTYIGDGAFHECHNLISAMFLGDAPSMGGKVFDNAHSGFTVYYQPESTGFTSPLWYGYPCTVQQSEIAVQDSSGADVPYAGSISYGRIKVGTSSRAKTFTIRNLGTRNLTDLKITTGGANAPDFTVTDLSETILAPGASITFDVSFLPGAAGERQATLHIASNDADENPFDIVMAGTGIEPKVPEIVVHQGEGAKKNLRDNKSTRDFGGVKVGQSSNVMVFLIKNTGTARLRNVKVSFSGKRAKEYKLIKAPAKSVKPGKSTQFKVSYKPARAVLSRTTLRIASNDKDENPFRVRLRGKGVK